MGKKVADQLVEILVDAGIKRIYAVTGDSLNQVNDAVRRNDEIEWIHVRHEESGAYAASAEAQLNGIACCAGSSGPGHVHLINGLYDAHKTGASVIAIASTCPTYEFGTSYFQETNTIKLFEDCSGYNEIANTPIQLSRMLQAALQHSVHKKEVAVIGLPGDVASSQADEGLTANYLLPTKSIYRPEESELLQLAHIINTSEKITIFCGMGTKCAHEEILKLGELIKAPIAYSFKSKMAVQYNNPYEIGMTGLLGLPSAYASMHESDLLLMIGIDFPYEDFLPRKNLKIVQIDSKPERIGRRAKVDMGLAGDAKNTIINLLPYIELKEDDSFLNKQLKRYESVKEQLKSNADSKGGIDTIAPEYVASTINKLADNDAIFLVDTGMCCVWGARYLEATGQREMLGSFNHGSMANALPMSIGAALARPNQQIIALCGDGGLSMLLGDIATIVQYKLPIKLIVFENQSLGMVKLEMEVAGLPDNETKMHNPDFAAIAQAMGIKGYTVNDPDKLESTLNTVFAMQEPVLVTVRTDPNALAMPPKIEFDQIKGFVTSMTKLILNGRVNDVINTAKSNMKHLGDIF